MRVAAATVTLRMTGGGREAGETGEQQGEEGPTGEGGEVRANPICISFFSSSSSSSSSMPISNEQSNNQYAGRREGISRRGNQSTNEERGRITFTEPEG